MTLITLFILISFCSYYFSKGIKKHSLWVYIATIAICLGCYYLMKAGMVRELPTSFRTWIYGPIKNGIIPTILLVIVMFLGALDNNSKIRKKLMPIRAELSIVACIFTVVHLFLCWGHVLMLLPPRVFTTSYSHTISMLTGIYAGIIMIPLWITSYTSIRKKMSRLSWVNLQNFAYLVYALIYIHILTILLPKVHPIFREIIVTTATPAPVTRIPMELEFYYGSTFIKVLIYSTFFIGYTVLRVNKYLNTPKKGGEEILKEDNTTQAVTA